MRKIISWIRENILFLFSLFLLAFIPLYPKLPLLDVKNTWVYIRVEDFLVLFVFLFWLRNFFKRKITLKTPLTLPILIFWIIGAIATLHGVLIIFPTIANVFPNVAFLSFIRHIEYMSLFFIAYSSMKDKRFIPVVVAFLVMTFLAVVFYGFGQKYLEFPAFLTMNEEFAKGIPIQLSQLSRVPSTFAGHYDLAAYLVLVIPILVSLLFGFKNWLIKIFLIVSSVLGFGLLFMTVSRVSFFVLLIALLVVLFFQKRKSIIFLVPLIAIASFIFLSFQPSLLNRFGNTVDEVDVLIDGETGDSIGHVKYVPVSYFEDKIIKEERIKDKEDLLDALQGDLKESPEASTSP
ncbi:MAG: hypothetical protein HYT06_02215, partial [Candidatus Levybacteria bacterium]|nr:hypothetical protein [Candidatus Levybacteria bacterium]